MKISQINFKNIMGATAAAAMLFMGAATFTSCGKQGCTDTEASNYDADATDDDGSCSFLRDRYLGTYDVVDNCSDTTGLGYVLTIVEGSGSKLLINLQKLNKLSGSTVEATATENGFTITNATWTSGSGNDYVFNGTGTLNGTALTMTYTIQINGTTTIACSSQGTKN